MLSWNPNAIELLNANQDKIDWRMLSLNPGIFTKNIINITPMVANW